MNAVPGSSRFRPRRGSVEAAEHRMWIKSYRRINHVAVAEEVVNVLDADPDLKRTCMGLYLRAKETLHKHVAHRERLHRLTSAIQKLFTFSRFDRSAVETAERRMWVHFYRRIHKAAVAREVVEYLDAHPALRQSSSGLYLGARQALRREAEREIRAMRMGNFFRTLVGMETLPIPATRGDPATRRVRRLGSKSDLAKVRAAFASQVSPPVSSTDASTAPEIGGAGNTHTA